jgi:hypothetical protein
VARAIHSGDGSELGRDRHFEGATVRKQVVTIAAGVGVALAGGVALANDTASSDAPSEAFTLIELEVMIDVGR